MIRSIRTALALCLLSLAAPALAADAEAHHVTLETTSAGTVGQCQAEVSRSLKVCGSDDQCQRVTLGDETRFVVPTDGSFVVTASVSYVADGVIYGDAAVDRVDDMHDGARLVQTVKTGDNCSQVWSYEIHVD
jgi:hypothetical protein